MPQRVNLKVVLDTNLLISAIIAPNSPPDRILRAWFKGYFSLLIPKKQISEIKNVTKREKFKAYPLFSERIEELVEVIEFAAEIIDSSQETGIHSRDPKDDFILSAALGASANYLVTGDKDLLSLDGDPKLNKLKIIQASELLMLLPT